MDFVELATDGLINTGAQSNGNLDADLSKICFLAPQSKAKEELAPTFQIMITNGQLKTSKSTVKLTFEVGVLNSMKFS